MSPLEKLIYMVNQIARNLEARGEDAAITGIAAHIADFWDPYMKARIAAHLETGGDGLTPLARAALDRLRLSAAH